MLWSQIAKRQAVVNPENTFFSVKRFIGRKMTEVLDEAKQLPYVVGVRQCGVCAGTQLWQVHVARAGPAVGAALQWSGEPAAGPHACSVPAACLQRHVDRLAWHPWPTRRMAATHGTRR